MADFAKRPEEIERLLRKLADSLDQEFADWSEVAFIGIRSGGEHVAGHVVRLLKEKIGRDIPLGVLDISLYRDDISRRLVYPEVKSTEIPFAVDDRLIILVDDVLNTGRSVRAAIDHIMDLGRPQRIYLLVLFDRGGREIPIQADFIGEKISLDPDKIVKLAIPADETAVGSVTIKEVPK